MKPFCICALCLFFVCSCDREDIYMSYEVDIDLAMETNWILANQVTGCLNAYRQSKNLRIFIEDSGYASAYAVEHSMYMSNLGRINHDDFGYRSQALKERGAKKVGEVIAYGYNNAEDVVRAWLSSPSHKDIIEGDFTYIGYGIIKNTKGVNYFTLLFYL